MKLRLKYHATPQWRKRNIIQIMIMLQILPLQKN